MQKEENPTDGNLTQKEIIQLLLHNAQHMATREEVKSDIKDLKVELKEDISKVKTELKEDMSKLELSIVKVKTELKEDMSELESSLKEDMSKLEIGILKVRTELKEDISDLRKDNKDLGKRMDRFMFWSLGLTITSTFLILGLIYKSIGLK